MPWIGFIVTIIFRCSFQISENMHDSQRIGSAVPVDTSSTGGRINRQLEKQHGLLMLFNCIIKKSDERKSVADALGNDASYWPRWLSEMEMIERRELAVPLIAGLSSSHRSANVLVVQLMYVCFCHSARNALPCTLKLCDCAKREEEESVQFNRWSVTVVETSTVSDPFQQKEYKRNEQ